MMINLTFGNETMLFIFSTVGSFKIYIMMNRNTSAENTIFVTANAEKVKYYVCYCRFALIGAIPQSCGKLPIIITAL
jgi:hypothetical protein